MKKAICWFIGFFIMQKVATLTTLVISCIQFMFDYKIYDIHIVIDYISQVMYGLTSPLVSYSGYAIGRVSIYSIYIGIIFWVYRIQIKKKLHQIIHTRNEIIIKLIKYIIFLGMFCGLVVVFDYFVFPDLIDTSGNNQSFINQFINQKMYVFVFINLVIISPIVEEFTFRFILMKKILYKLPKVIRVVIAIFIFSFIHVGFAQTFESPQLFVHLMLTYIPAATIFVITYEREGNIVYPLVLHMVNNFASIGFVLLTV